MWTVYIKIVEILQIFLRSQLGHHQKPSTNPWMGCYNSGISIFHDQNFHFYHDWGPSNFAQLHGMNGLEPGWKADLIFHLWLKRQFESFLTIKKEYIMTYFEFYEMIVWQCTYAIFFSSLLHWKMEATHLCYQITCMLFLIFHPWHRWTKITKWSL